MRGKEHEKNEETRLVMIIAHRAVLSVVLKKDIKQIDRIVGISVTKIYVNL